MKFGLALLIAAVAGLAFAISAGAATPSGVTGTNLTTTPDTSPEGYASAPSGYTVSNDGLGVPAGAIKHVWVIVMENHAYESNFTGLNANNYLSKSLPAVGAELTNYYGTGHSSLDNYLTMTSGQAPMTDDQDDCPAYTQAAGSVDLTGSLTSNGNYGQFDSAAGANAPAGDNGCVYPSSVPTLFNQLDAANKSWKVYAQDLAATGATGQNGGMATCDGPDATIGATPSAAQTANPATANPVDGSANATDQYVAKHSPLPWFESIIGTPGGATDCSSSHLANMFTGGSGGLTDSLYSDLQSESTTPAFSYLVPDNCSNGHDAECAGNNLSGMAAHATTNQSEGTPINQVGGAYSSDLFLEHVIPEIMESPAYSDGGLIAVVWDEAYPQFTYSNDSLADSTVSTGSAFNSLTNDSAGETLFGKSLNWEPSGPNVPNVQTQGGQQLSGGPGFNEYLHRPSASTAVAPQVPCLSDSGATNGFNTVTTSGGAGGCYLAGGTSGTPAAKTFSGVQSTTGGIITESGISASSLVSPNLEGEQVTAFPGGATPSTTPVYVGQVTSSLPAAISSTTTDTTTADQYPTASFQLVDGNGNPVTLSAAATGATLTLAGQTTATDPLYDANDPTGGGGDTGAILISPYIKGGTVSNTYYNHYSLLRSLEDMFQVSSTATGTSAPYTGSISLSQGLDGAGHLGYAAQPGLAPFGTDVFTDSPLDASPTVGSSPSPGASPSTVTSTVTNSVTTKVTVTAPSAAGATPAAVTTTTPAVTVTVAKTIKEKLTLVPAVLGLSLAAAERELHQAALKTADVKGPNPKTGYALVVTAVSPRSGTTELLGHSVTLTVKLVKDKK